MDNFNDFYKLLDEQLKIHSFQPVRDAQNIIQNGIYIRLENPILYILGVYDAENMQETPKILDEYTNQMRRQMERLHCTHLICVAVSVGAQQRMPAPASPVEGNIHTVDWHFVPETGSLCVGEGAPNRLLGIERLLQAAAKGEEAIAPILPKKADSPPRACMGIFGVCLLLLLCTTLSPHGDAYIAAFGLSRTGIFAGEYYRFFTSMFLHGGVAHLLSNGIFLYYFGVRAEALLGTRRFLLLYFLAGLTGGIFSILCHDVLAIGASGAIYGLLGGMLVLTRRYGARYTGMNYATMLLLAMASMGFGFLDIGVDNFAHIGGFLGGGLLFQIFIKRDVRKQ